MAFPVLKFDLSEVSAQAKSLSRLLDINAIDPDYSYKVWLEVSSVKLIIEVKNNRKNGVENIGVATLSYLDWNTLLKNNNGITITCPPYITIINENQLNSLSIPSNIDLFICVEIVGKRYKVSTLNDHIPVLLFNGEFIFFEILNKLNPNKLPWTHFSITLTSFSMSIEGLTVSVCSRDLQFPFDKMKDSINAQVTGTRIVRI